MGAAACPSRWRMQTDNAAAIDQPARSAPPGHGAPDARIWPARSCGMPACRSHDPSTDTQGRFKWTRAPAAQHRSRRATPGGDSCGSCRTYCRRVDCGFAPSCQGGTRLPSRQCREPGWRDARVLPTAPRSSRPSPEDRRGHGPDSRSGWPAGARIPRWWQSRAGTPAPNTQDPLAHSWTTPRSEKQASGKQH